MKIIISLLLFNFGFAATAGSKITKAQTDKLAAEFFATETLGKMGMLSFMEAKRCEDQEELPGNSCVDTACDLVGHINCDDVSEIERIGRACRGNANGKCIESTCILLGRLDCDDVSEIEKVAAQCRGNVSGKCVDAACGYLGHLNCDDFSEVERVNRACKGVKASCIDSVCQRVGRLNCDDLSEIERIADSCRGS